MLNQKGFKKRSKSNVALFRSKDQVANQLQLNLMVTRYTSKWETRKMSEAFRLKKRNILLQAKLRTKYRSSKMKQKTNSQFNFYLPQKINTCLLFKANLKPIIPLSVTSVKMLRRDHSIFVFGSSHLGNVLFQFDSQLNNKALQISNDYLGNLNGRRIGFTMSANRKYIIIFGGQPYKINLSRGFISTDPVFINSHDFSLQQVFIKGNKPALRKYCISQIINNLFVVHGGVDSHGQVSSQLNILEIDSLKWTNNQNSLNVGLKFHCSCQGLKNSIIIYGGINRQEKININIYSILLYRKTQFKKQITSGVSPSPSFGSSLTRLEGKLSFLYGGRMSTTQPVLSNQGFLIDIEKWQWIKLALEGQVQRRYMHGACQLNQQLFIFGGFNQKGIADVKVLKIRYSGVLWDKGRKSTLRRRSIL